eukprot:901528-Pelagomonas_calceolata.AAC.1
MQGWHASLARQERGMKLPCVDGMHRLLAKKGEWNCHAWMAAGLCLQRGRERNVCRGAAAQHRATAPVGAHEAYRHLLE